MSMRQSSRGWAVFTVVGLALWIGATVFVSTRTDPVSQSKLPLRVFAVGGALFFGTMFLAAGISMRRSQLRGTSELYEQLAITPVSAKTVRRALRGAYSIGYVYLAFGVLTTFIMLAAIWFSDEGVTRTLMYVVAGLLVVWLFYAGWALKRVYSTSDALFEPLGLRMTTLPTYTPNLFGGGGQMEGAVTYEGERRGRKVSIVQTTKRAVTIVAGPCSSTKAPSTPTQMSKLTGQQAGIWKGAVVAIQPEGVTVTRSGNGAGRWFLNDLLLAETVAGQ